jgi:hypothetical protein
MEAPEPQGVFTRRFIAGIAERKADSDGDGRVTHAELLDYVTVESEAYCERNRDICGLGLTPSLVGPPSLMSTAVTDGAPVPVTAAVSAPAGAGNPAPGGGPDTGGLGASAEDGRLSIRVEPDARRPVGDRIRIWVDSQVAGDFTLFEVAPSGAVTRLIPAPDSYIDRYRIAARASEVVPAYEKTGHEWFGVAPLVGAYRLVAVVSEAPLNQDLLNRVLTESGAQPFIDALAAQLRAPVVGADETVRRARWSLASATYEVVP